MRNTMKNWMLGTALIAGVLGTGAVGANAQDRDFHRPAEGGFYRGPERGYERPEARGYYRPGFRFGVAVGGPVVEENYIPPCPGDGYVWTAGYYNGGVWVPGSWIFRGGYGGVARVDRGWGRDFDRRRDFDRGREFDHGNHGFDRGNARGYDRGDGRGFNGRR